MQNTRGRSEEPRPRSKSQSQQPKRSRSRAASRDSSVSSLGREVRCGCQFFQSDSLLPERVNPVGRPSSRTSNIMASPIGDHEYEPIGAPQFKIQEPRITDDLDLGPDEEFDAIKVDKVALKSETSSTSSRERRFLRIPLDDEMVVLPGDGEDEDEAMAIKSMEGENGEARAPDTKQLSAQELQSQLEDRYFAATPTTTESRTDCDVNTSQLDSSGLEDIPLKREARRKKQNGSADQENQARGFQQKLRSQAGRIRSKLRNMPKPNIKLPERPKFNLPERPKFHLPERPKFNLPERPKFNLPERPKFNLPERPKFNLPERPKFNFPDRSKFHLPERPKFNLPEKFTMPERPKFNFPQRPKLTMPAFVRERREKSRHSSSTRRPLRERSLHSSASTASSTKRNIFDFDFKSRIFDRKSRHAEYATSSPKNSRGQTPPPQMPSRSRKGRLMEKFTELKYAEDPNLPSASETGSRAKDDLDGEEFRDEMEMAEVASGRSESTTAFRDKDYGYAVTIDDADRQAASRERIQASTSSVPESDRETRSLGSASLRHRAGVLEEIDSDEFFLREKGLSQEDVEVGRYLTSEIRDAFRAPVSALSQMDNFEYYDDEEDVENLGQQYRSTPDRGPTRPARTRTLHTRKRSSKSKEPSPAEEEFFNTFPPARPKRSRRFQQSDSLDREDGSKDKEEEEIEIDAKEEPIVLSKREIPSFTVTDEDEKFIDESSEQIAPPSEDQWQAEEEVVAEVQPPMPPKRLRRTKRETVPDTLCNGDYTKEDWLENLDAEIEPAEEHMMVMRSESDYIIPAAPAEDFDLPPEPPRRGRKKSSRATSLVDEDRTSRGAESLPSERDIHTVDIDFPVDLSLPEIPGYASIEKSFTKPRRQKPLRPSAPGRRKRSNGHSHSYPHFYSLPHRPAPIRPLRNYSTLGPSRPPRNKKRLTPELDQKSESYIEMEDDILEPSSQMEESHGSARDLQSGDIIERMKGRPLPPPPRPPRKGREGRDAQEDIEDQPPLYKDEEAEEEEEEEEELQVEEELEVEEELLKVAKEQLLGTLHDDIFLARPSIASYDDEKFEDEFSKDEKELSSLQLEEDEKESSSMYKTRGISPLSVEIPVEEVCVGTQTDPLPDDVCVVTGDEEIPIITTVHTGTETASRVITLPKTSDFGQQTIPEPPPTPPPPTIIEKPIPYYVMPDPDTEIELKAQKLQVSELDVERLNVGELQAQKILVSDIDGMSLQVAELTSKSGNLVVSGLELPPGFLQDLYDSLPIPTPPSVPPQPFQIFTQSIPSSVPVQFLPQPPPTESLSTQESHSQISSETSQLSQTPVVTKPVKTASESQPVSECKLETTACIQESTTPSQCASETIPSSQPVSESATRKAIPSSQSATESPCEPIPMLTSTEATSTPAEVKTVPPPPPAAADSILSPQQTPQTVQTPQQIPSIPIQQSIPIQSILNPNLVASLDGLHSYIPEYMPSQVRVPSRTRSHLHPSQRELESEEEMISLMHTPSTRRRRHHVSKPVVPRYSSDEEEEEEEYSSFRPPSRRHHSSSRVVDSSIVDLSRQLVQACHGVTMRALHQLVQYIAPQVREGEDKRRDLQIALCILLVLVAGLILMGFGSGKTYHHHHWDYHFPPAHP